MAIHDLLWACPLCGAVDALARADKGDERCRSCGASFRRGKRALIEATHPDGTVEVRSAAEWAARLPPPGGEGGAAGEGGAGRVHRTRVLARFALGDEVIRRGGTFLGIMERLGPERPGTLALAETSLELKLDDGEERHWRLDEVAALQASSTSIQLRPRGQPIVSFAFPESSARLWEERLTEGLRVRWRSLGRGEIVEFQPRIVTGPAWLERAGTGETAGAPGSPAPPGALP